MEFTDTLNSAAASSAFSSNLDKQESAGHVKETEQSSDRERSLRLWRMRRCTEANDLQRTGKRTDRCLAVLTPEARMLRSSRSTDPSGDRLAEVSQFGAHL
jgi:hypothetical protein